MKPIPYLLILLLCPGCFLNFAYDARLHSDKKNIPKNVIMTGQYQKSFQKYWGDPTRTFSKNVVTKGANAGISWGPGGGGGYFAMQHGRTYDLWYYVDKQVTLVFYDRVLVYWHWGAELPNTDDVVN